MHETKISKKNKTLNEKSKKKIKLQNQLRNRYFNFVDISRKYEKRAVEKISSKSHLPLILPLKLFFKCYLYEIFTSSWISPKITSTTIKPSLCLNKCSGFSNVYIAQSPKSTRIIRSVYTHAIKINIFYRHIFGSFISNEKTWTTEFDIIVP